ncbi:MAG: hypothetical protein WCF36_03600 [Candidatus Nanopelagicales bacterium]
MTDVRRDLVSYLAAAGWSAAPDQGEQGQLWRKQGSRLAVPVPRELESGGPEWELILDRLARIEESEPNLVEQRIRRRLIDVANLRAANGLVIADTIPYAAGVSMVRDSWTMFRSCATTSLGARPHIAGNYRRTGDSILEQARMAHTRRGSFIIPIYMPVPEPEKQDGIFQGMETAPPESDERRVMRTFAESLSAVQSLMQPEREPTTNDVLEVIHSGVSHEFAASLHRILMNESVAEFSADFEWATAAGPVPSTPRQVEITAAAAERVKRLSRRLKSEKPARGMEMLTGPVVAVQRDDADTGGVVTIQTVRGARPCHVSVNVTRERLDEALDWMKQRATALVTGHIHRTGSNLFCDRRDGIGLLAHEQLRAD